MRTHSKPVKLSPYVSSLEIPQPKCLFPCTNKTLDQRCKISWIFHSTSMWGTKSVKYYCIRDWNNFK